MVLLKVRLPAPELLETMVVPVKLSGFAKEMAPPVVRRVPEREVDPPPLWANVPEIEVDPPAARTRVPLFAIATGPEAAVMRLPLIERSAPESEIPPAKLVFRAPKEEEPVPAAWVIVVAVMFWVVTLFALSIVNVPKRVEDPTLPEIKRFPLALSSNELGPSIELDKVILPPCRTVGFVTAAAPAIEIAPLEEMLPPRVTPPPPVWLKEPPTERAAAPLHFRAPWIMGMISI